MERGGVAGLLNVLTSVLLGLTVLLGLGYVVVLFNPSAPFNPLPPPTGPGGVPAGAAQAAPFATAPLAVSAGAVAARSPTPASSTARPTATETPLPRATASLTPTIMKIGSKTPVATLVVIVPSGPPPTPTWTRSPFKFTIQGDAPIAIENVFNPAGCAWTGIGGQAFDLKGQPTLLGYVVHLEGGEFDENSLTGTQPQYGPDGYEFKLADAPKKTTGLYRIQLRDPQNIPVSDWVTVNTFAECSKNVLIVNFLQNH